MTTVQLIVRGINRTFSVHTPLLQSVSEFRTQISETARVPSQQFYLLFDGRALQEGTLLSNNVTNDSTIQLNLRVKGGIDFQHREGSKIGSGGQLSESQAAIERRERLRKLALETIDITKDPYIMRNHLGTFECKLCLTIHPNEGNYLAHTQGKRHQSNLGRRAAMEGL
jgi:splicing factor 3A subunit 2